MANIYTTEGAAQNTQQDNKRQAGKLIHGRVREAIVQYAFDGTESDGDVLYIVKFDHPVRIDPQSSYVHASAAVAATSATMDIGDDPNTTLNSGTADVDRYGDAVDVGAAGIDLFTAPAVPAAVGTPTTIPTGEWIVATLALSGTVSSSAVLTFRIKYSIQ